MYTYTRLVYFILSLLVVSALPSSVLAGNCTSPAGVPGALERLDTNGYHVCIGSTSSWHPLDLLNTAVTCTKDKSIDYDTILNKHKVCDAGTFKALTCTETTTETAPTYVGAGPTYIGTATSSTGSVTLAAGQSLLVCLAWAGDDKPAPSMTWNGLPLTYDWGVDDGMGGTLAKASAFAFSIKNVSTGATANLSVTHNDALLKSWTSIIVNGLASGSRDGGGGTFAVTTTGTAATVSATTQNNEFLFACLGRNMKGADTGTWGNSFTGGGYVATAATGNPGSNVASHSGYRIVTSTGSYTASKSFGATSADTATMIVAHKSATTTSCSSFGACTAAGTLDYSAAQNGLLWCDGSAWRKTKTGVAYVPPTPTPTPTPPPGGGGLGAFSITGVTGGSDTTVDNNLSDVNGGTFDIHFELSNNATTYMVQVVDAFQFSVCSQYFSSSPASNGVLSCSLNEGSSYGINITAESANSSRNSENNGFLFSVGAGGGGGGGNVWNQELQIYTCAGCPDSNTCGHPTPLGQSCPVSGANCTVVENENEYRYNCQDSGFGGGGGDPLQ